MNKGQEFWLELWQQGRTAFHRKTVNADLERFWPMFNLAPSASVLVPLCGKSLDMLWLAEQGFQVIGIELSELAILQFAEENQLPMEKKIIGGALNYSIPGISIWVTDIFSLNPTHIKSVDAIYDRAALIALPKKLRLNYVQTCLQWLKRNGIILLKTMNYDEGQIDGPPFSLSVEEVQGLYKGYNIQCLSEKKAELDANDPLYARGLVEKTDYVWQILSANSIG